MVLVQVLMGVVVVVDRNWVAVVAVVDSGAPKAFDFVLRYARLVYLA